jgi:hypothetical protein
MLVFGGFMSMIGPQFIAINYQINMLKHHGEFEKILDIYEK